MDRTPDAAAALARAHEHALTWLATLPDRAVPPTASVAEVVAALGAELPDGPTDPAAVVDLLAEAAEPGLTAIPSGRFFGFVMGGTHPAGMAADWLTSAWDQNAGLRTVTPAATAAEDVAEAWVLDLLGLPAGSAVGFVTGGTMANFTCLAAARDAVLARVGWDIGARGLVGSPGVRVLVGAERHDSVDLVLRYLGLGAPELVAVDEQGRIDPAALREMLGGGDDRPVVVAAPGRATSTPGRSTLSKRRSRRRTSTARGCTSTARSGSSPAPPRRTATSSTATRPPTPGRPTPTRRSTCRTTAGWRSCATRPPCGRRCRCTVTT